MAESIEGRLGETTSPNGSGPAAVLATEVAAAVPDEREERRFDHDGRSWVARIVGSGLLGTGSHGLARLVALRFYSADEPTVALRELLLPVRSLETLHAGELAELLQRAQPLPGPTAEPESAPGRRKSEGRSRR